MSTPTSSYSPSLAANLPLHQSERVKTVAGYALQQRLGSGSFATVYKGIKVSPETEGADIVAIKAIARTSEKLTQKILENLELEISILRTYRHPNIVCLHNVQKTERHFYLCLEFCGGGDVQRLIRTRKTGRLTERLTRRLIQDLASGLQFLWGQELIHRDIKPQNLLLTGPLPLDELYDPARMEAHEEMRRQANFPSEQFALKIADFGFARHLQTTSLAETLCGSPLYMAPEILQHQRYDAKADLWSVGTVLFEMISGRPPFNGENHIDLLRNIQRKAVRLPPDVKVSKECVKLLRILLNRNPLSRAGFKEFLEASDAFVALGCEGIKNDNEGSSNAQSTIHKMDLGTIHEVDNDAAHGAASMMTTETTAQEAQARKQPPPESPRVTARSEPITIAKPVPGFVTPPFGPMTTPSAPFSGPPAELSLPSRDSAARGYHPFTPLEPSPPPADAQFSSGRFPSLPFMESHYLRGARPKTSPQNESSQNSSEESEFVMVDYTSPTASGTELVASGGDGSGFVRRTDSRAPASPRYLRPQGSILSSRGDYLLVNDSARLQVPSKGMLSTSPGTGGALMGMMGGSRVRLLPQETGNLPNFDSIIDSAVKMIATAEDVGRRAISVAHLGDARAYMAMRLVNDEGSILLTGGPMEGVVEENDDQANVTDCEDASVVSKEAGPTNRQRSFSATDRSMASVKEGDDDNEEMPFAVPSEAPPSPVANIPSRVDASSMYGRSKLNDTHRVVKPNPEAIRSHLGEALSCYLKALSMLKGVVNAVQRVRKDIDGAPTTLTPEQRHRIKTLSKRCDVTSQWLTGQFTGVLERADAANVEISKLAPPTAHATAVPVVSVGELMFNHSLACGRDGAVKQLLGQYDASRSCYRSAGLLAETLLMEPSIGAEDRKVLEGYVDGFAARITELDGLMQQQSRTSSTTNSAPGSRRGSGSSGVIPLIGGIPAPNVDAQTSFRVSSTNI